MLIPISPTPGPSPARASRERGAKENIYQYVMIMEGNIKRKNRIVIAAGLFPPDIGGPATFAKILADELPKNECEVKVVAYGDDRQPDNQTARQPENKIIQKQEYKNIRAKAGQAGISAPRRDRQKNYILKVSRKSNIWWRYFKYFWEVWKLRKWGRVVYAFDLISVGLPGAAVKMLHSGIKLIVRVGGDYQWEQSSQAGYTKTTLRQYYRDKKFNWRERIVYGINNFVLRRADKVIFNSDFLKDIYLANRPWLGNKARVIKNIRPEAGVSAEARSAGEPIRILCAGRLTAVRNVLGLLKAYEELLKDMPGKVRLDIIGNGPQHGTIEKYITDNELRAVVNLQAGLERTELLKKIAASDIMALISLSESNPHFITEALALGKRVVVTKESELGFLGLKHANIYYVEPLNKDDITSKLEMAVRQSRERESTGAGSERGLADVLANLVWEKDRVVQEHIKLFNVD